MTQQELAEVFRAIEDRGIDTYPVGDEKSFQDATGDELSVSVEDTEYTGEQDSGIPGVLLRIASTTGIGKVCLAFSPDRDQLRELAKTLTEYSEAWDAASKEQ